MYCRRPYIILFLYFLPAIGSAQAIDNTASFRNIRGDRYFRIYYENDFFTGTDRDYTQGIYIEKVNPCLSRFFLSKILWRPRNSVVNYGLALEQDVYTPNHLDQSEILHGDRPYAGVLLLRSFLIASDVERGERISTSFSGGLIGPGAGGKGMQTAIHHWINYITPLGWPNQIRNDLALNYQVNYEKELLSNSGSFSLAGYGSLRLGTLSIKAATGVTMMAGSFSPAFGRPGERPVKKAQWYIYDQPLLNVVGYDASLEGGVFNHSSPYTIAGSDIDRLTFQNKFGIVLILKKWYLEYYQTSLTEEFRTSIVHRTGGIEVGFGF